MASLVRCDFTFSVSANGARLIYVPDKAIDIHENG